MISIGSYNSYSRVETRSIGFVIDKWKISSNMEELFQRFPDLCSGIFGQLDNQNLVKSKEVAVSWCHFINFKISWIRMIQKYGHENIKENPNTWREVIFKDPHEIVKKVAIGLELFFKHYNDETNVSPIDTAAYPGVLQLCVQILEKIKMGHSTLKKLNFRIPGNKNKWTPLQFAALGGTLILFYKQL